MKKMFFAIMLILRPLGYRRMPIRRERLCEEQMRDRRTDKTYDWGIHTSSSISAIVSGMLPKKVPATVRQEVANTLAKAYMAHLAGDERMPEDYTAELKRVCKFYSRKRRIFATMEYLVAFFFRVVISRMNDELLQKERNSRHTFLFWLAKCSDRG